MSETVLEAVLDTLYKHWEQKWGEVQDKEQMRGTSHSKGLNKTVKRIFKFIVYSDLNIRINVKAILKIYVKVDVKVNVSFYFKVHLQVEVYVKVNFEINAKLTQFLTLTQYKITKRQPSAGARL